MALGLKSLRGKPQPTIDNRTDREKLVAELAECTCNDDATLAELTAAIKLAEKKLEACRQDLRNATGNQIKNAIVTTQRRNEIEQQLRRTAPEEIDRVAQQIARDAEQARLEVRSATSCGMSASNCQSVEAFIAGSTKALAALDNLKLSALEGTHLEKAIVRIVASIPKLSTKLVEVS